ncbi:MAG: DUF2628 domain-containing protein [Hyphomicrobium sp.]
MTYTVHEPPGASADRADRASELKFVRDGFHWPTAVFPPLGLIAKQLWLPLVGYIAVSAVLVWLLSALGLNEAWSTLLIMALNIYLGFEISSLERFSLDNAGWRMLGAVSGRNIGECERRFLEDWLPAQPIITSGGSGAAGRSAASSLSARTTSAGTLSGWPSGSRT